MKKVEMLNEYLESRTKDQLMRVSELELSEFTRYIQISKENEELVNICTSCSVLKTPGFLKASRSFLRAASIYMGEWGSQ